MNDFAFYAAIFLGTLFLIQTIQNIYTNSMQAKYKELKKQRKRIEKMEALNQQEQGQPNLVSQSSNFSGDMNNLVRRNSSYVDLNSPLTRRMKDEQLDHPKVLAEAKHPITRICLTGGPCAGKTTALATLSTTLQ